MQRRDGGVAELASFSWKPGSSRSGKRSLLHSVQAYSLEQNLCIKGVQIESVLSQSSAVRRSFRDVQLSVSRYPVDLCYVQRGTPEQARKVAYTISHLFADQRES
jgi:hypothetical protein